MPADVLDGLKRKQRLIEREMDAASDLCDEVAESRLKHHKRLFARIDAVLDKAAVGPRWLGEPEIARLVETAILSRCAELYKLWAYVIMVNHVHLLLRPKIAASSTNPEPNFNSLSTITKRLKGYTAREANRLLDRICQPFWQQESFDHWPRDRAEFFRIIAYIENNPVKAGLVARPEEWLWSSASERRRRGWTEIRALT